MQRSLAGGALPRTAAGTALVLGLVAFGSLPVPLSPSAAAQSGTQSGARGRLAGSVEDLDGAPVAGARVILEPRPAGSSPPRTTSTDERGRFSLAGLVPGRWDLRVEAEGLLPAAGWVDVRDGPRGAPLEIWMRSLDEVSPTGLEVAQEVPRWLERGNALLDAGRPAEARAEYEKALAFIAPAERPEVLRAVARTFFLEQDVESTVATLERALRYDRGDTDTRALYSALLGQLGRAEEAARHLGELDAGPPPEPPREPGEAEPPPPPPAPPERPVVPPEAHRTGTYRTRFETGGPLADPATIRGRYGPMLDRLETEPAVGLGPAGDPAEADAGNLAGETFEIFVPESYRPGTPQGLLVWVSPTPWGGTGIASEGHDDVFAEHGVIRIAANAAGNRRSRLDRVRLALAAAWNAARLYEVDPARVWVGGYSGGGKIAGALATLFPEVFRGSLHLYGVSYFEPVPVPWEPGSVWLAAYPPPPRERREAVVEQTRWVLVTGERDFNRGSTRAVARRMEDDGFEHVTLLTVPGASHYTPLPPGWLERALEALDPRPGQGGQEAGRAIFERPGGGTMPSTRSVPAITAFVCCLATALAAPPPARAAATDPATPTAGEPERTALVGGRLIDGFGGEPVEDSVVLVEGERIVAVGREGEVEIPEGTRIVSTEGMSVLPGLWDMHVHLMIVGHSDYEHWDRTYPERFRDEIMPAAAEQLLAAGVTSARDLGAPLDDVLAVRERIERGEIPGPTLYVSGPFIQKEPYPGTEAFRWGVDGVEDARAKVRRLAEAGVDVVKLIDQDRMTMEEVHAVVDEAHAHGLPVIAHSHRPEEIRRGIAAGVDGFEHTGLGTAPEYPEDVFELMKGRANTLFWTPTIAPLLLYEYTRDNPERIDDPRWHRGLPEDVVADVARSLEHPERLAYYQLMPRRRPTLERKFEQLRDSGVVLLIGTDSGVPLVFHSDSTWREIDTWVRVFGVPVTEALQAATYWPAVAMGVEDEVGTVSPGKYADVIAVRGDVLRHPELLQDVDLVMKRGEMFE